MKNFNLKGVVFFALLVVSFCFTQNATAQCTYNPGFTLPLGKDSRTPPPMARPDRGVWYKDSLTSACVVRLTNSAADGEYVFACPDYSRRQAFNCNNTKVLIGQDGHGNYFLYNAATVSLIYELWNFSGPSTGPGGDAECQWSPTSPDTLYYMDAYGGLCIYKANVNTKVSSYAARFTAVKGIRGHAGATSILSIWPTAGRCWTKAEGSPSADGRYWGYLVETSGYSMLGYMVYDMQTDSIIGVKSNTAMPDHCSMSPSGRWFVVSGDSVLAYPPDLSGNGYFILGNSEHSDMAFNTKGEDIYCYDHYGDYAPSYSYGQIGALNLDTHEYFSLGDLYGSSATTCAHFSGRALNKPGWMVISTASSDATWNNNKINAFELVPNGRIAEIACQYTNVSTYFTEVHATVSRDFTHLVWATTFGLDGESNVETAMCVLPTTALPDAATGITEPKNPQSHISDRISINNFARTIHYTVDKTSLVQIRLFNSAGKMIKMLENGTKLPGTYNVQMDISGRNISEGVYFCETRIGENIYNNKTIVIK